MIEVIPAIIPDTFQILRDEMSQVKELVPLVQIDVIDGKFAPEATWPYNGAKEAGIFTEIVEQKRGFPFWDKLQFEVDLMVEQPEEVVDDWIMAGASAVIVHASSTDKHADIFATLAEQGTGIGLALKPADSNEIIDQFIDQIDFIQVMGSNEIGYHGVELDPMVYDKIADIRKEHPELSIAVDIGVTFSTAPRLVQAGATRLVSGSAIFESEDMAEAINRLEQAGQ
ncbi:MAG: hypothetical protein WD552_02190 [Candidatus Paceibacterota bacterium]